MFRACFGKQFPAVEVRDISSRSSPNNFNSPLAATLMGTAPVCQPVESPNVATRSGLSLQPMVSSNKTEHSYTSPSVPASAVNADTTAQTATGHNASRIQDLEAANVNPCDAHSIMEGLRLTQRELGRGSFGVVIQGSYRGLPCAVKILTSSGLDRTAVRELLVGPRLVHPHVVLTYISRCAILTHEFFDMLEGESCASSRDQGQPRMLQPLPVISGDGFGDPRGLQDDIDPLLVLHHVLYDRKSTTGQVIVVVVQELCDKTNLDNGIHRGIFKPNVLWSLRLARRALLRTASEIARGLLHLHDVGVVHGDVKPANVLINTSRDDRRGFVAKVADFGLSNVLPHSRSSIATESWGSVAYMAPEAFSGQVSRATDVWSFGVCLWEMLTGKRPYDGMRRRDFVPGVQEGILRLEWPEDPPMADGIVRLGQRCMSFDPNERPSLLQVVEELVAIERGIRAELLAPLVMQGAGPQVPRLLPENVKNVIVTE